MRNLAVGIVAFVLTIGIAVIPQTPAKAHHSVLTADCVVDGSDLVIEGVAASWLQDPGDDDRSGNPHIDILFDGVVVFTGAYTSVNGYEFAFGPIPVTGPGPVSVSSVAVAPWNNGTGQGQTDTVSVSLDDCEVPPSSTTTSTTTTTTLAATSTTSAPPTTAPPTTTTGAPTTTTVTTAPPSTTTTTEPTSTSTTTTVLTSTTTSTSTSTSAPPTTNTTEPPDPLPEPPTMYCDLTNHDAATGEPEPIITIWPELTIRGFYEDITMQIRVDALDGSLLGVIEPAGLTTPGYHDSWISSGDPVPEEGFIATLIINDEEIQQIVCAAPVVVDPPPQPPPPVCFDTDGDGVGEYIRDVTEFESEDGKAHRKGDVCKIPFTGFELWHASLIAASLLLAGMVALLWSWDRKRTVGEQG